MPTTPRWNNNSGFRESGIGVMIIHVDMDAFYASVEELDNPKIRDKPVIVGGPAQGRGVVSAANYRAREFGVKSAMPMVTANRLCPKAIVIPPRHQRYLEASRQFRAIFERYTPLIEPLSLDEAFLDVSASTKLFGSVKQIARRIKQEIQNELGLTASVGIAPNKFLAKLASDADKPDGFVVVDEAKISAFLDPMPVNRLWGVGKSAAARLQQHGIYSVLDLRQCGADKLENLFGASLSQHLWRLARGVDTRPVIAISVAKSISRETTFTRDVGDKAKLRRSFAALTEDVCQRLRQKRLRARTVQIKYRRSNFSTFTRSESLDTPSDQTGVIWNTLVKLADAHIDSSVLPLRLVGVGLSNLTADPIPQADLFLPEINPIDTVADSINRKFGKTSINRAAGLAKKTPNGG